MIRAPNRAPPLAGIAAAAGGDETDRELVDALIACWLFEKGLLEPKASIDDPGAADRIAVIPGWSGRAVAAERLQLRLLPGWRFEPQRGGSTATLVPPATSRVVSPITGSGPTLARAIVSATFSALLAIEVATPVEADLLAEIRDAMKELAA